MYPYTLIRSDRRTVSLEISRDGQITVRAPMRMSKKQIDGFVSDHNDWIEKKLIIQQNRALSHPEPTEDQKKAFVELAHQLIPKKVEYFSGIMGLKPTAVTITSAQHRFGSCSSSNRLCFSWRLMGYPDRAIDYVVVHELAHIVHKNHGKEFYELIGSVLPDYKDRIKLLKE